ncbi:NADH-quinone oxidoreductase subunit NuoN [Govanella unica]|uniref:NADH-quinone oxidoreductase subunit N n=1 Tax=Govanella unica TaxID=2975056 RepID=A0A9X3TY00_9PROT|nr:NADH-quinone oxidoreductase subunit NuoN [Govania unica]MDA5193752.1 NADH-quinone oxidoreductase subunit NuoN [Govania unica]
MTLAAIPLLGPAYPEILLAVGSLVLLVFGVFSREEVANRVVTWGAAALLVGAFLLTLNQPMAHTLTFGDMFIVDGFTRFAKLLVFLASALAVVMSTGYLQAERMMRFEYPILIVLAALGMGMMVSANDLLSLYVGLELQSLALYVLAAIRRDSAVSTEAGLKYFVLGALSSGMLLYGSSLVYGFSGTTNFEMLAQVFAVEGYKAPIGMIFGIVFLAAGLAFKVSAVPFHMWTPDVYEGSPTPVTAFFAVAPKIAALALFARVVLDPFADLSHEWRQIIVFLSLASMVLGSVAAIVQTNIKRLMAYSSIGHVGYALVGLAAGTHEGVQGLLVYLAIYLAMNIGAFACILAMRREDGTATENISDLAGLAQSRPMLAAAFAVFMFSLAGIPPLAGFFGKFYIFISAVHAGLIWLAVLGVLASVIGAYYYLRIVKVMYFDAPTVRFEASSGKTLNVVLAATAFVTVCFVFAPSTIVVPAATAAAALVP